MDTEYQKLLEKYLRLKEENQQLRSQLRIEPIEDGTESQSLESQILSVNQFSSAEDKIKLFVAFIEADCRQQAIHNFQEQYRGQNTTIAKCEKLFK